MKTLIEITLNDILNSQQALQEIAKMNMRAKTAFKIARIIRAIEGEIENFNKARQNLLNKYGEKDNNGNLVVNKDGNYTLIPNKINDYNNEIQELLITNIQLNIEPIEADELEQLEFTPTFAYQVEKYIKK